MVRLAANLSFLFKERPFLDRFQAAAAAGFRAVPHTPSCCRSAAAHAQPLTPAPVGVQVEFMFPGDGAYIASADEVAQRLASHKLEQVLLNAPAGDWGKGERGLGGISGREAEFQQSIETGLGYCERLGCARMHVMAGMTAHGATEEVFAQVSLGFGVRVGFGFGLR